MKKKFTCLPVLSLIPSFVSCSPKETTPVMNIDMDHLTKVEINHQFSSTKVTEVIASDTNLMHKEIKSESAISEILSVLDNVFNHSTFYDNNPITSGWETPFFGIKWGDNQYLSIIFSKFPCESGTDTYAFQYHGTLNGLEEFSNVYGFYSSKELNDSLFKALNNALKIVEDEDYILD